MKFLTKQQRYTPDGASADDSTPSERGDIGGKLKRRTVSSADINRLAQVQM